jgi:DNA-binding protein HU-beta
MNKAELIEAIVTKAGLSKKAAKEAVDAMIQTISKTICDGEPVRNHGLRDVRATPAQG